MALHGMKRKFFFRNSSKTIYFQLAKGLKLDELLGGQEYTI